MHNTQTVTCITPQVCLECGEELVLALMDTVEETIAALQEADKAHSEQLAQLAQTIAALEARIAELEKNYATKAALEGAIARLRNELYVVRGELLTIMAEGDEALSQKIADLAAAQQALNDAIIAGDQDLDHKITLLNEGLTVAIAAADAANEALRTELNARIDEAVVTLEAAVAQVRKDLEAAQAALAEKDAQHDAQLEKLNTFVIVVCVIASLALAGCAALLVITVIGKGKKV